MHRMRPFDAVLISDRTGSARRSIIAFDALRHQVLNKDYRRKYEEKLAIASKHPQVWVKRLEDVAEILFDMEKWFGRDISLPVDLIRRKHAEIMARTCPEGIKVDLVDASKAKIDEDEANDEWSKAMAEIKANVEAAFAEPLDKDVDDLNVKDGKTREEESFNTSMDDAGQYDSLKVDKVKEEASFEKSMVDFETPASDTDADKAGDVAVARHKDAQQASVPNGFRSEEAVFVRQVKIQSPPSTTKRKEKSSVVGDIGADALARGREPDASKTAETMKNADGGELGEIPGGHVRVQSKGTKRKDVAELDKVRVGSYSCTAL